MKLFLARYFQHKKIIFACLLPYFLTVSCSDKVSQCQQIIKVANSVVRETKSLTIDGKIVETDLSNWLKAASIMEKAAQKLNALPITDPQLTSYKASYVRIYKVNSQATYDIVKARENRDIVIAKAAQTKVKEIGKLEKEVSSKFNNYCQQK